MDWHKRCAEWRPQRAHFWGAGEIRATADASWMRWIAWATLTGLLCYVIWQPPGAVSARMASAAATGYLQLRGIAGTTHVAARPGAGYHCTFYSATPIHGRTIMQQGRGRSPWAACADLAWRVEAR